MRVRSMVRNSRGCHAGLHLAAAGVDALDLDFVAGLDAQARLERAVPDGVGGFGGERWRSSGFHSHGHLNFDQCVARQCADADGGAHVAACFAEDLTSRSEAPLMTGGRVGKSGRGIHVAIDGEDLGDAVERAEFAR